MKDTIPNRIAIFFCFVIVGLGSSEFADILCSVVHSVADVRHVGLHELFMTSSLLILFGIVNRERKGKGDELTFAAILIGIFFLALGFFGTIAYGLFL